MPAAYDVKAGNDGNIWFTSPDTDQIGMVDYKTLKVSLWTVPTPDSYPRRMQIDGDGIVWFGEFNAGKMGRFDPNKQKFTEYPLPGPEPTPYGLGIDATHHIWYASYRMEVVGRSIHRPVRRSNTRSRIPRIPFANCSSIRRGACGTDRRRMTKSGISR